MHARRQSVPVQGDLGAELHYVAWHGGGSQNLKIGKRHVIRVDEFGKRYWFTLCGRHPRGSHEVAPDSYWTTGDCKICADKLQAIRIERRN